jgi:hypothetical protein
MVPIWAISSRVETGFERRLMSSTAAVTAISMPRFRSIGLSPAAIARMPSWMMARARTVAVVVPSPATSLVLLATSRTIWRPCSGIVRQLDRLRDRHPVGAHARRAKRFLNQNVAALRPERSFDRIGKNIDAVQ